MSILQGQAQAALAGKEMQEKVPSGTLEGLIFMARRGRKNKGGKKGWSFSVTSIFSILYALYQFGVIDFAANLIKNFSLASYSIQSEIGKVMSMFQKNWMSVAMTTLQLKIMAKVLGVFGMSSIGKFWKVNLRW